MLTTAQKLWRTPTANCVMSRSVPFTSPAGTALAHRLAGSALVRLSGGWWKEHGDVDLPDALGVALRFRQRRSV